MEWLSRVLMRVNALWRAEAVHGEIAEEWQFHIDMRTEENVRRGMSDTVARRDAERSFGNAMRIKDASWDARGGGGVEMLLRDLRFGARQLRRSPSFTLVAILSLALAIGANAAVFSVVNALFLRSVPVQAPGSLLALWTVNPDRQAERNPTMLSVFEELQKQNQVFSGLIAWQTAPPRNIEANGTIYLGAVTQVSGNYFATLGVEPLLGRVIGPEDVASIGTGASSRVAVLDYRCWQGRFGGDPRVLGQTLMVDGTPLVIIGVTPEAFAGLDPTVAPDAIVPIGFADETPVNSAFNLTGRLKAGMSAEQANAYLKSIWPNVLQRNVPQGYRGAQVATFLSGKVETESARTGSSEYLRHELRQPLMELMGLALLVLLVACLNLANLILARTAARRQELGIRASLGAKNWILIRTIVVEGILVSVCGATTGVLAAFGISRLLLTNLLSDQLSSPLTLNPNPDLRVLVVAAGISVLIGVICALVPAWRAIGREPASVLRQNARGIRGGNRAFQKTLISLQIALALVLTISAVIFARNLYGLRSLDPGFRVNGVVTMDLFPQVKQDKIPNRTAYYQEVVDKLSSIPGVQSVSYAIRSPLSGDELKAPVSTPRFPAAGMDAVASLIGPSFFKTMGMRVVSGREFDWTDDETSPHVAVVSESLANDLFPGTNPIGQIINVARLPNGMGLQIVGIVNSASLWKLQSRSPRAVYIPLMQAPAFNQPQIQIRTDTTGSALMRTADQAVESLGHHYSFRTQSLAERMKYVLSNERVISVLALFFAGLAILLASAGLYGLISYTVVLRTSEIGIRLAVGAQRRDILWMILKDASWLVLIGLSIGIPVAIASLRLASAILFQVSPYDPAAFGLSLAVLAVIALGAAYLPARRASHMDPVRALGSE